MKKVLFCVTGLTPQIVTETLYALAHQEDPWVPDEIWLLTTARGAEHARLTLFIEEGGWFHRLVQEYNLPPIAFNEKHILVLEDGTGPIEDVRTEAHNHILADAIVQHIRAFCAEPDTQLHVSLAGGRKTMSFFAGYVLSLFGRPQDKLSHVLVSPAAFESHPQFFYPTPYSSPIRDRQGNIMDRAHATVTLAEVPFLRLNNVLDSEILQGDYGFAEMISRLQTHLSPQPVKLDMAALQATIGGEQVHFTPINFLFYSWLAHRHQQGKGIDMPPDVEGAGDFNAGRDFAQWVNQYGELHRNQARTLSLLEKEGLTHSFIRDRKAQIKKQLRHALGLAGEQYAIKPLGQKKGYYGFTISAEIFEFLNA